MCNTGRSRSTGLQQYEGMRPALLITVRIDDIDRGLAEREDE